MSNSPETPQENNSPTTTSFKSSVQSISSHKKCSLPIDTNLYSTTELSQRTENFNIIDPYPDTSNSILQKQNPSVFLFRNKPVTVKPEINNMKEQRSKTAHAALRSTLLQKRPLTSLKEPTIPSVEIVQKKIDEERQTIAFKDDPLAYFSKKKEGHGHRFIYLVYKYNPIDPLFSPYELEKIPSALMGEDFFTMSATGITHTYEDGTTETMPLNLWANEKSNYNVLRKLKFFSTFFYWKQFQIWRNFVMQQRYDKLLKSTISNAFFRNPSFFKQSLELYDLQLQIYEMLRTLLLTFHSHRKYKLEEFKDISYKNIYKLKNDYTDFIISTTENICQLYREISDPRLVQVQDSDFPQIKRRNPNLGQLLYLEKAKAEKRFENTQLVNNEIQEIGSYIRMIDYMLLETLVDGCIKCWTFADENVLEPKSSCFQVEVLFDEEGKVAFNPKYDDLLSEISIALDNSISMLNKLPRILYQPQLQQFLRDNGSDIIQLTTEGPNFSQIMSCTTVLETVKERIIKNISDSYKEAFLFSQSFGNFYPIFKMGKTWNVRDYVFTRSGKPYEGSLNFDTMNNYSNESPDEFLLHSDDQPVVDFLRVAQDMEKYREDIKQVNGLRSGAVRGSIFVDSHGLKAVLIPIPQRSLLELQELLTNMTAKKIWQLNNALKYYSTKLKIVPQTLDDYVTFCAIFTQTIKVMPQIREDIEFIDKMYKLFDDFGFIHAQNTVHASYSIFITDQTAAQSTRDDYIGMFTDALKGSIRQLDGRIRKYQEKVTEIPVSIKEADVDNQLPHAIKLCKKIDGLRSRVQTIVYQQSIMGIELNNFNSFEKLVNAGNFAVKLYEALEQWNEIQRTMTHVPFASINMKKFHKDIDRLKETTISLQSSAESSQNYPILNELISKIQDTAPFVEQLELLAFGKMQLRHWNMLFEACDRQNAYHNDITIEELMNLGILRARDKIAEITATSQGESELETEFLAITNYWNRVEIPLADSPSKMTEETLLLGSTESLLVEIQDTLITLNKMLSFPYVTGIKESVTNLYSTLESLSHIIEAWQLFQLNWVILSALFSMDEAKSILPHQSNKFSSVQRKWTAIARFTLKDPRLFQVAIYPSLLQVLNENNSAMESILASLGKFIDAKRFSSPRLSFLSNKEVLAIATSLKNFSSLVENLPKIFMNVVRIDCHENDNGEGEENFHSNNLQHLKIYGLIGEDGTSLQFDHPVQCRGQMNFWITNLIKEMKSTVKNQIVESIKLLNKKESFVEWAITTSPYIQLISLHCYFTNEIEQCFISLKTNSHSLVEYETLINQRIKDIKTNILDGFSVKDEYKYSCLITILIKLRDHVRKLIEYQKNSSYSIRWVHFYKIRHESTKSNQNIIFIEFMDKKTEHGYEFWGKIPNMVYSPSINDSISALTFSWMKQKVPLINSSHSTGKQLLLKSCACLNGAYLYIARSFPDLSPFTLSKLLIGGISSGAWLIFTNIDTLSNKSLCYLFDSIRLYYSLYAAKSTKMTIELHQTEINRSCRFFLTANTNYLNSSSIPPQLKSYVRPISLTPPPIEVIINSRLISLGIERNEIISKHLANFIESVSIIIYQVRSCSSSINHSIEIIEQSYKLNNQYNEYEFDFITAYCCYERFICMCDETRKLLLQRVLYLSFQICSNTQELMTKIENFKAIVINETIRSSIKSELSNMALDLPIEYLTDQTIQLISLMKQYSVIIIVGPPNSGKTTVLNILSRVFERQEVLQTIPKSKPYLITPIFPQSDSFHRVFGYAYEDAINGPIFSFGYFQSALYYLRKISKKDHILKLDGKLTPEISLFLSQFLGSHNDKKMMSNTLDTFEDDGTLHLIIETSNLNNATPLLLSKCGILLMHNHQIASPISPALPVCRLALPNIPFSRALNTTNLQIKDNHIIKDLFNIIAPKIIKYVYYTPNIVCYAEYAKRLESGTIILTDVLASYAAIIGMYLISENGINEQDENLIQLALIFGFFQSCFGILEINQIDKFDDWLQKEFNIKLPENWIGFNVSDPFWDCYNKPSLLSMTISNKGKLIPLDFHILDDPVTFCNGYDENQLPYLLSDVKICHAQLLPQLRTCDILLTMNQNIIIHGPPGSGKTSFLHIFFSKKESYIPVFINASDTVDIETIISYIAIHTPLISKATAPNSGNKTFVLIFEGLKAQHTQIIEFIRMLISQHTFPLNSPNDEKVFEFAKVHLFNIIVTTQNYRQLPSRFLINFCPVQLEPFSESISSFITKEVLSIYGYEDSESESIIKTASIVINQYPCHSLLDDLLLISSTLCFLENKRDNSTRIAAILSDLYYATLHRFGKSEISERITFIFQSECKSENDFQILNRFLSHSNLIYPIYNLSRDNKTFDVQIEEQQSKALIKTLKDKLVLYNMASNEKIVLRFTPHILTEWSLLYQAISCPGRNAILEGRTGSGRYTMTRFVTYMCESDFVYIADPTPEEMLAFEDRKTVIFSILKDVISNAAIQQKKSVIFMRATKNNEKEVKIITDCILNADVLSVFTKGSIEELIERITSSHNLSYKQRNIAVQSLINLIRMNVHVVISKSSDIGYEINYNGFNTILFSSESKQALSEITFDAIENQQTKKVVGSFEPLLIKIFPKIPEIASKFLIKTHTNQFYDFVDTFAHFCASDFQDISIKNDNIQSALAFINQLKNELNSMEKRLDAITPTLNKLQGDSDSFHSSYKTRKDTILSRREKVEQEYKTRSEEVINMENEIKSLQTKKVELEPRISCYQKCVENLSENDINTIRITAIAPPKSLKLLLEIFCLFLDLRPSYENGGQKLLMDPNFVKTITSKVSHMTITSELLSKVMPYFDQIDLNPTGLENSAPALRVLYDWIYTVCKSNQLKIKSIDSNVLLEKTKKDFEDFKKSMEIELATIDQVEQSLESENKALEQSAAAREQMEKEFKQINARKKIIEHLFAKIDQLTDRWNNEIKDISTDRNKVIGNSIIFAFYLVYCGGMTLENRKKSLEKVVDFLKTSGIETTYEKQPLEDIKLRFVLANPSEHIDRLPQAAIDAHHATTTLRTPLIIDPDGIVLNYITNGVKHKTLQIVSSYSSTLDTTVSMAIQDGKTLIITDVNDLNPVISSILSLDCINIEEPKMSLEMQVGTKLITWDKKFKLYLTSSISNINRLSDSLLSRVTLIDTTSSSLLSSYEIIANLFVEFFNPELLVKFNEMKTKIFEYKINLINYEQSTLDLLADIVATQIANSKYDFLNDDETINEFNHSKDNFLQLLNNPPNHSAVIDEYNKMMNPFLPHVRLCHDFWNVMSRDVPLINKTATFSFHNYTRQINGVFNNEGFHPGILSADQHSALSNSLIQMTFQFVSNKIPYKDVLFFMFMSGFVSHTHLNNNKYNNVELLKVLTHIRDEVTISNCEYMIKDKDKNKNKLTEEAFDHLLYTNVVNLFHYVSRFIVENYGPDYSSHLSYFQSDLLLTNSASFPTIIVAKDGVDPTSMLLYFVSLRCKQDNIEVISLTNDLDQIKEVKRIVTTSQNRGSFVLIYYSIPSLAAGEMLSDISAQMKMNSVNTNFRLIIIATSLKYISPSMLVRCKRISIDNFPSVRSLMIQMVQIYGSILKTNFNSIELKKLLYGTSLLLSLVQFRSFVKPFGFNSISRPNEILIADSIDIIKCIIEQNQDDSDATFSMENFRDEIMKIIFAYVPEYHDKRIIYSLINQVLSDDILNDDFSIASEKVVVKNPQKWSIPNDGQILDFIQAAHNLPVFNSPEVLGVYARTIRNWNMAVWLSKPFIKFSYLNKFKTNKESISASKSGLHYVVQDNNDKNKDKPGKDSKTVAKGKENKKNVKIGTFLDKNTIAFDFNFENALIKIETITASIPKKIGTGDYSKFTTVFGVFLLSEVENLNQLIIFIKSELEAIQKEYFRGYISKKGLLLSKSQIPKEWKKVSNFWISNNLSELVSFVNASHRQLMKMIKNSNLASYDLRYFFNPKLLFQSFLLQFAIDSNISVDRLKYEFHVTENSLFELSEAPRKQHLGTLSLKGGSLGLANVENGFLTSFKDQKNSPFQSISLLIAQIVIIDKDKDDKSDPEAVKGKLCQVPLYHQVFVDLMKVGKKSFEIENNCANNFVWNLEFSTDEDIELIEKSGIAMFCRVPKQIL